MKKLFFILLIGVFITNDLKAGIRVVRVNCPNVGYDTYNIPPFGNHEGSSNSYECIAEVNGGFQFCLFLQRANPNPDLQRLKLFDFLTMNNYKIKISIDGIEQDSIPLNDFEKSFTDNSIGYTKMYQTNVPDSFGSFDLEIEVLKKSQNGNYYPFYGEDIFDIVTNDNSTSDNPSAFTFTFPVCWIYQANNPVLTCTQSYKMSNTNIPNQSIIDKNINEKTIKIHPNPFKNMLNIQILDKGSAIINFYNAQGKIIKQLHKETNDHLLINTTIETMELPLGMYICEVITEKEHKKFKLLKTD